MLVEAHRRLTAPLTTLSYALVALVSVLTGTFRRHGGVGGRWSRSVRGGAGGAAVWRSTAWRRAQPALIPLMWVRALLPALVCALFLYGPALRNPCA